MSLPCPQPPPPSPDAAAGILAILAFCIIACFYQPLEPEDSPTNTMVSTASLALVVIFTVEALIKVGGLIRDRVGRAWSAMFIR